MKIMTKRLSYNISQVKFQSLFVREANTNISQQKILIYLKYHFNKFGICNELLLGFIINDNRYAINEIKQEQRKTIKFSLIWCFPYSLQIDLLL